MIRGHWGRNDLNLFSNYKWVRSPALPAELALRDEPNAELRRRNRRVFRDHERRWLLMTAGRWPWKSESAKECVTTHLPKQLALKMDGAGASCLYSAVGGTVGPVVARGGRSRKAPTSRMARRCASKGRSRDRLEPPSVQILVVVANTREGPSGAAVEKGFLIGSEERGGSGSGRRRSVGGAGDTPAVARAPGLRTGSLEAVAGPSPSADRGTTELRSLAASRPAVRPGVGSPSPGGPAAAPSAA
ncbi:hypothetical protein AGLY_016972 [Aphis glycines]|uniref:Uncharacterized protein n=1 Tax=Aphis glycines TaxID=307491 RepID=A0A6G0SYA2_APHGL|nr:hypothetical protein AGLY_016972 [Aphis glycines]